MAAIDSTKSSFVLVFVDSSKGDYSKLPAPAKEALSSSEAGNYIPKMAVLDPEVKESFGAIRYEALKEGRTAFRDVKKKVKEFFENAGKTASAAGKPASAESWTSADGRTIQAKFVKKEGSTVSLLLENGQMFNCPIEKLSEGSRKRAEELASNP